MTRFEPQAPQPPSGWDDSLSPFRRFYRRYEGHRYGARIGRYMLVVTAAVSPLLLRAQGLWLLGCWILLWMALEVASKRIERGIVGQARDAAAAEDDLGTPPAGGIAS